MSFLIPGIQESSYMEENDVYPIPGDPIIHLHEVTHISQSDVCSGSYVNCIYTL